MKKPFSIVDAALNVIRVCLAAGILITLFDFFLIASLHALIRRRR